MPGEATRAIGRQSQSERALAHEDLAQNDEECDAETQQAADKEDST